MENVQKLLKEIQILTGWPGCQIGQLTGVSQATISRLMLGKTGCYLKNYLAIVDLHKKVKKEAARRDRYKRGLNEFS